MFRTQAENQRSKFQKLKKINTLIVAPFIGQNLNRSFSTDVPARDLLILIQKHTDKTLESRYVRSSY